MTVYKLVMQSTVEEEIFHMQVRKLKMNATIMGEAIDSSVTTVITAEELEAEMQDAANKYLDSAKQRADAASTDWEVAATCDLHPTAPEQHIPVFALSPPPDQKLAVLDPTTDDPLYFESNRTALDYLIKHNDVPVGAYGCFCEMVREAKRRAYKESKPMHFEFHGSDFWVLIQSQRSSTRLESRGRF